MAKFHRTPSRPNLLQPLQFNAENLEPRRMMAGNVTANIVNGELSVSGDGRDNEISVVIDVNRNVSVLGANGTSVSGNYLSTPLMGDTISIRLRGGDDVLNLQSQANAPFKISIDTGGGDDDVDLSITVAEALTLRTGGGNDKLWSFPSQMAVIGTMEIQAGGGDDFMRMGDFSAYSVTFVGGGGDDYFDILRGEVSGTASMTGNSGDDYVFFRASSADRLFMHTGGGRDWCSVSGSLGSLTIDAGASDDAIDLGTPTRPVLVYGSTTIVSRGGADRMTIENTEFNLSGGETRIDLGSGNDHFVLTETFSDNATFITTGAGHDTAEVYLSTLVSARIEMGGGGDALWFGGVCGTVTAEGGSGPDELNLGLQCVGVSFNHAEFEMVVNP